MPDNVFCFFSFCKYTIFLIMKRKTFSKLFLFFLFSVLALSPISCDNNDGVSNCFPNQYINFSINLNASTYYKLQTPGGWDYTKGEDGTGTRGLIIYNIDGRNFHIFNRNAPHLCPDSNTTLEVITDSDGFQKIHCPKDGAKWLLFSGEPLEKANIPPRKYHNYQISNGILHIFN